MAKICILTFYDKLCLGIRYLSSIARQQGHEASLIFVKDPVVASSKNKPVSGKENLTYYNNCLHNGQTMSFGYDVEPWSDHEIKLLINQIERIAPDIIGISTRSFFTKFGTPVMRAIKEKFPNTPFVCGGFGPAFDPGWFLNWADYVVFGEYDSSIINLLDAVEKDGPLSECNGLIFKDTDGKLVYNPVSGIESKLDKLPFPDWDDDNKYLIQYDRIAPGSRFQYREDYSLIAGRGCFGNCSYCMAWKWRDTYKKTYGLNVKKYRLRSPQNIIEELKKAKEQGARFCTFVDPVLTGPSEWVKELRDRYSDEIGLPFQANCHPLFTDDITLKRLIEMGLKRTCVGIQSGSRRIRSLIFNRNVSDTSILTLCNMLDKHDVLYDIHLIGWNPYETIDDYEKGLALFLKLKSRIDLNVFRLQILPGSTLFDIQHSLTPSGLSEQVHLYYAYLFSFVFNNEKSRKFALSVHESLGSIDEKIFELIAGKEDLLAPSYIASAMPEMIFSSDTPRNRLIGSGFTNRNAKKITMDYDGNYILDVLDSLENKMQNSIFSEEDRMSFLAKSFIPKTAPNYPAHV